MQKSKPAVPKPDSYILVFKSPDTVLHHKLQDAKLRIVRKDGEESMEFDAVLDHNKIKEEVFFNNMQPLMAKGNLIILVIGYLSAQKSAFLQGQPAARSSFTRRSSSTRIEDRRNNSLLMSIGQYLIKRSDQIESQLLFSCHELCAYSSHSLIQKEDVKVELVSIPQLYALSQEVSRNKSDESDGCLYNFCLGKDKSKQEISIFNANILPDKLESHPIFSERGSKRKMAEFLEQKGYYDDSKMIAFMYLGNNDLEDKSKLLSSTRKLKETRELREESNSANAMNLMTEAIGGLKSRIQQQTNLFQEKLRAIESFFGNEFDIEKILFRNNKSQIENLRRQKEAIESMEQLLKINSDFRQKLHLLKEEIKSVERESKVSYEKHVSECLKIKDQISCRKEKLTTLRLNEKERKRYIQHKLDQFIKRVCVKEEIPSQKEIFSSPILFTAFGKMLRSRRKYKHHEPDQVVDSHQRVITKILHQQKKIDESRGQILKGLTEQLSANLSHLSARIKEQENGLVFIYNKLKALLRYQGVKQLSRTTYPQLYKELDYIALEIDPIHYEQDSDQEEELSKEEVLKKIQRTREKIEIEERKKVALQERLTKYCEQKDLLRTSRSRTRLLK